MQILFTVDGAAVEFRRSWFTGRAELQVGKHVTLLQDPLDPSTHASWDLTRTWEHRVGERRVLIEVTRPRLFAGLRPMSYRVLVDDEVVATAHGY